MKRVIKIVMTIVALSAAIVMPCNAAKEVTDTLTASDVFVNLPLKTLEIIDRSRRLDMLDYYAADSIYKAPNGMEGYSELVKVTPDFLEVQITPVTEMQILILPKIREKEAAAVVLYTINGEGQAADTDVSFFDTSLKELPRKKYLEYPEILDFFDVPDKETRDRIEELVPFPTIEFRAVPGSTDLTATLTVGEFMGRENYDFIKKYMKKELIFRYDGKKYKLNKGK